MCEITRTKCCALDFVSGIVTNKQKSFLVEFMESWEKDYNERPGSMAEGPRTMFLAVTVSHEEGVKKMLEELGWEPLTTWKRRKMSGGGTLTLWHYIVKGARVPKKAHHTIETKSA